MRDSDWLNFKHLSGYKYKIRLVSILRKREDQALICISTILKFSARINFLFLYLCLIFILEELQGHNVVPVLVGHTNLSFFLCLDHCESLRINHKAILESFHQRSIIFLSILCHNVPFNQHSQIFLINSNYFIEHNRSLHFFSSMQQPLLCRFYG